MNSIIKADDVAELINKGDTVIVDARGGADAYQRFLKGHLEHAFFLDLETDLSAPTQTPENGGRHPLPAIEKFADLLGRLGIRPSTKVLIYDDKNGAMAATRFWWMLNAVGHQHLYVVSGGFSALINAGLKITTDVYLPQTDFEPYPVQNWSVQYVGIEDVEKSISENSAIVIDVREAYRYNGESEPIDLIAGHIPGAINLPYTQNLDEEGRFLEAEQLNEIYYKTLGEHAANNIIVHCGSGVTACHTLLALANAGFNNTQLYVGSWSEWSRNAKPMVTKMQN